MQQLQQQNPNIVPPPHAAQLDDGEEEMDEEDLKLYQQFLAQNKQN